MYHLIKKNDERHAFNQLCISKRYVVFLCNVLHQILLFYTENSKSKYICTSIQNLEYFSVVYFFVFHHFQILAIFDLRKEKRSRT